jgi:hypothetical protein
MEQAMAFVTFDQLRKIQSPIKKSVLLEDAQQKRAKDIFLSHSHFDRGDLAQLLALFSNHGSSVYIDFEDRDLPEETSGETAARLRKMIQQCRKFIVAISQNIQRSRWVPWELGFADGVKNFADVALFPIVGSVSTASLSQEYLDIYPRVEWEQLQGYQTYQYSVYDPRDKKYWTLKDWLRI